MLVAVVVLVVVVLVVVVVAVVLVVVVEVIGGCVSVDATEVGLVTEEPAIRAGSVVDVEPTAFDPGAVVDDELVTSCA